jgi:hypothetical protein
MTRHSIKAVDLYCSVANWNDSIAKAYPDEIERWTAQRDRKLASFRKVMVKVTLDDFLSGRWGSCPMHRRLAEWADMQAMAAGRPFCELPHPVLPACPYTDPEEIAYGGGSGGVRQGVNPRQG